MLSYAVRALYLFTNVSINNQTYKERNPEDHKPKLKSAFTYTATSSGQLLMALASLPGTPGSDARSFRRV